MSLETIPPPAAPLVPFQIRYSLSRRQRLAYELFPWLPAIAGTLGFVIGAAYLFVAVAPVFGLLFLLPVLVYRGLFRFLWSLMRHARIPAELRVDQSCLYWHMPPQPPRRLPLEGIIQVCRTSDPQLWNVLHRDGSVIPFPAESLTPEQLDYLKGFAWRAALRRRAAEHGGP
ncbi:MAG: hypothetical protein NZU63_12950 [Gemmataceae bacterium]|nr:hypothetical protein [Gemmataceae bacterium]MDW8244338.1 hypothetical protein [Thermogemmata sp.]